MKYSLLILLLYVNIVYAGAVQPAEYSIANDTNTSYIFPADIAADISSISTIHNQTIHSYEKTYGYKLDQRLFLTFASQKDQIANGFSTQFPLNEQVYFGGGVGYYDYFTTTSWIKTLLIHETAHSFQLNPKENCISKFAHKISGNSIITIPFFIPLFPSPNITESSYILEGNAVLNESIFGNGGRLYSGYALAETITQARAGNITPQKIYNSTNTFPYGEKFYLIGGHFQKFLAQRYGLDRVNGYFRAYAKQPFPFFSNAVFKKHYGKDFVALTKEFQQSILTEHKDFRPTRGELISKSQVAVPLERDGDEVYTLVGDKKSAPKILQINTNDDSIRYKNGGWRRGRVLKLGGKYYTQSSAKISAGQISMGLFDTNGYIKKSTVSKVVQGKLADGREVYFDVAKSWGQPHLYVDGKYYGVVNSSVFVSGNDLYYFKQAGERRYLYKNRQKIFGFNGHYGAVTDVDLRGRIYFVAPSKDGSTAYRIHRGHVSRVTDGDDVIGLKYTGGNRAVVQTVSADGFSIKKIALDPKPAKVAEYDLRLPSVSLKTTSNSGVTKLPTDKPYSPVGELKFSSLSSSSTYDSKNGYGFATKATFIDPLWQNTLAFTLNYQRQRTFVGASYSNSASWLHFGGSIMAVKKNSKYNNSAYRSLGYSAYLSLPFLATGYWRGKAVLAYNKPYNNTKRESLTLSANIGYHQQFGYSKYPNTLFELSSFVSRDRSATYAGLDARWMNDLSHQTYLELNGAYLYSSKLDNSQSYGIKIGNTTPSYKEKAALSIPTLSNVYFAKSATKIGIGLYKVLDYSWYNYHLPLSLSRESLYLKHNIYRFDLNSGKHKIMHESIAGIEADVLVMHNYTVPVNLELLYNKSVNNKVQVRMRAKYRF